MPTLDLDMQQAAERALAARLEAIENGATGSRFPHQTYQQFLDRKAERGDDDSRTTTPYLQGLVVSIEAKTGLHPRHGRRARLRRQ